MKNKAITLITILVICNLSGGCRTFESGTKKEFNDSYWQVLIEKPWYRQNKTMNKLHSITLDVDFTNADIPDVVNIVVDEQKHKLKPTDVIPITLLIDSHYYDPFPEYVGPDPFTSAAEHENPINWKRSIRKQPKLTFKKEEATLLEILNAILESNIEIAATILDTGITLSLVHKPTEDDVNLPPLDLIPWTSQQK